MLFRSVDNTSSIKRSDDSLINFVISPGRANAQTPNGGYVVERLRQKAAAPASQMQQEAIQEEEEEVSKSTGSDESKTTESEKTEEPVSV